MVNYLEQLKHEVEVWEFWIGNEHDWFPVLLCMNIWLRVLWMKVVHQLVYSHYIKLKTKKKKK